MKEQKYSIGEGVLYDTPNPDGSVGCQRARWGVVEKIIDEENVAVRTPEGLIDFHTSSLSRMPRPHKDILPIGR